MFILVLYPGWVADLMDRSFPTVGFGGKLLMGSMANPEMFEKTAETFTAASTTFRFDRGASVWNPKRRGTTLTGNLTACVIRCPERSGIIQVEFTQDGTGSRTIPTPTAVKADGTTAVVVNYIGNAFMTETTTANATDTMTLLYDEDRETLREISRNLAYDES